MKFSWAQPGPQKRVSDSAGQIDELESEPEIATVSDDKNFVRTIFSL
jgi:hypothetical protein